MFRLRLQNLAARTSAPVENTRALICFYDRHIIVVNLPTSLSPYKLSIATATWKEEHVERVQSYGSPSSSCSGVNIQYSFSWPTPSPHSFPGQTLLDSVVDGAMPSSIFYDIGNGGRSSPLSPRLWPMK